MPQCPFISGGHLPVQCQLQGESAHRLWGFHMAWTLSGVPMLKSPWWPDWESEQ